MRLRRRWWALISVLGFVTFVVWRGWPPASDGDEDLDIGGTELPPAEHIAGLGGTHHAITTSSPEAQQFFDQGLALVYSFNFLEAMHSFQRAATLDPKTPMPYWGIALARGPNFNSGDLSDEREEFASAAIEKAETLEANGSPEERALIEAFAKRVSDDPDADRGALAKNYADAMGEVSGRFPDDPDVDALYAESLMDQNAWRLWSAGGQPAPGTELVLKILRGVLARWPEHLGANHYLIHALEASPHPEEALAAARLLPTLAPAAGHIVHMPGHIYMRTGDYADAVAANEAAVKVDEAYAPLGRRIKNETYEVGYAEHNLRFLTVAAEMDGDFDAALRAAERLQTGQAAGTDANQVFLYTTLVRFGRWGEILELPQPAHNLPAAQIFYHFAHVSALAQVGKLDQAQREVVEIEPGTALVSGELKMVAPWPLVKKLVFGSLWARIAVAKGDWAGATAQWAALVAEQDAMPYHEPPAWYPTRESFGAALLRSGKAAAAEAVFREDLKRDPKNPRSLFGLSLAMAAQHEDRAAAEARLEFQKGWRGVAPPRIEDY